MYILLVIIHGEEIVQGVTLLVNLLVVIVMEVAVIKHGEFYVCNKRVRIEKNASLCRGTLYLKGIRKLLT
ncbi:hypothetical protein BAMA_20855 [Bacillus manliponensis]|uniref:Uncharacterized protein n=1 Tax=Bacillus manliponensis TaxID=574376 RepID=A0A073KBL2_9BACI|nr:hypothetical protein BAMA_20855 [Bacillus manliponensis]